MRRCRCHMYHVRRRVVLADVVNSGTFDFRNGKDTFLLGWENRDGGRITLSQEAAAIFELTNSRGAKVDVEEVVGVVLTNVVNYEGASIGVTPLQSAAEDPFIELNDVENSGEITISASLTTTLRISGHNLATGVLSLSRGFIDANMSNDGTIEMNDLVSGRIVFNGGSHHKVDCGILDCPLLEIVSMPAPPPSPGSPPSPAPPPPGYRELFYTDSTCETPYTGGFYESHGGGSHHRRALQEATHTINTWTQLHLPENSCCQKHCPGGCTGVVFNEYVYERFTCGTDASGVLAVKLRRYSTSDCAGGSETDGMGGAPAETGGDYPVDLTSAWEEIRRAGCTERGVGFGDPPPPIWAKYEYNLPTSFYQECLPAPSPPPPPVSPGTVVLSAKIETDEPAGGFAASGRIKLISGLQATGGGANVSAAMATLWSAVDLETGLPFNLTGRLSTPATDRNLVIAPCALEMSKSYEFTLSTWIPRGERIPEEWAAAAATNATVVVSTRTAPSGGSLVVSPTSGVALSTDFTLQAADWASPYSGTTYTYSFAYVAGSGGAALAQGECSPGAVGLKTLSAAQAADSVIRTLPAGNHTLTVVVTDSHGASPCSCTSVAIEVLPVAVSASVATATVDTAAGLIADDPSAGAAYLAPLTDSLNEDSSSLTKEEVEQVREDVTALLADAATTLQTAAEDPGGAAADSALVDQLSSALKSAVATTDQVSNRSVDSGADSLAALMGARKDEGVSDSAKQNVIEATSSLLTATVGIGAEDAASREQVTSLFAKLTPLLSQLADKMRDTAVVGEVATASSPAAAVATSTATPDTLVGEYTAAPFTGGASPGSMTIPDGIGEALGSPTLIDVSLITSTINPHQGEADETTGTQLFDIKFAADGGGASSLQALASPLVLAVPLAAPSSPAGAACTADSGCNAPLGACTGGVCACEPEYGNCTDTCDCGTELACTFWDDAASAWSDYGVTTLGVGDDNALSCESNHTTEFAGVYFPTSASAWASDVPVPALPCSGGWVWLWGSGGFWSTWGEHSTVYITIFSVLGANVLLLPLFRMRYHLRFRKAREKLAKGIRLNRVVKPWTRNSTTSTVEPSCSTALTEASESKPKKEKPAKKVRPKKEKTPKKQQVAPYDPGAQVATTAHESSELYSFDDAEISAMAEASGQLAMSPPRASVDYKGEAGGRRPSLDELRIKGASSSSLIRMEDNLEAQAAAGRAHAAFEGEAGSNRSLDDMPSSKASPSGKRLMKQKSNCDSGRLDTAAVSPPPSPPARVGKGKAAFASGGLLRGMSGKTGPAVSSTTDAVTPRQVAAITAVQAVARGNATRAGKQNWQHVQRAATLRDVSGKGKKKGERSTCRAKAAQGEWSMASVARNAMSRHSIVQGARNTGKRSVEHVRDRHTLVSVTNPLDVNVEEQMHLRDEQLCQLFFHALVWELVMCCVWVRAVTITSGGSLHVRNMLIVGFSTAFTQIIVVLFTRLIFRIGNRAIYRAKVQGAERRKKANVVWALCWAFNLGTLLAMAYVTLAYAYCFGDRQTYDVFYGWGLGMGISWLLTEPFVILVLAVLPSLCKCECIGTCFERMDDAGLNPEICFG